MPTIDIEAPGADFAELQAAIHALGVGFQRLPKPPVSADFTWINQLTATRANAANGRGIIMTSPAQAATQVQGMYRTVTGVPAAAPWRVICRFQPLQMKSSGSLFKMGVFVRDQGNSRIYMFGSYSGNELTGTRHTVVTGIESTTNFGAHNFISMLPWRAIYHDGVNLNCQVSGDGFNWLTVGSRVATDITDTGSGVFLPGFGIINGASGMTDVLHCQHFEVEDL